MTKWAKETAEALACKCDDDDGDYYGPNMLNHTDCIAKALDEAQRKGLRAAVQFIRDHVDGVDIGVGTQEIPVSASMLANELEEYIKQAEAKEVN
jgi:hypothetical protein